jgi:hypothetical protein
MTSEEFKEEISNFYLKLFEAQETLGYEFEKILHDNLWELYGT